MEWIKFCEKYIPKLEATYLRNCGSKLNLKHPTKFTEKVQWLKIYDSTFLKTYCADKINIHDYCIGALGKDYCIPITNIYKSINDINLDVLPNQFAMKCNHGSGYNIIVHDKKTLNYNSVFARLNKWIKEDYSEKNGCELHYKLIERRCFTEEFMNDGQSNLTDYKIYCFNGTPIFTQVIQDRHTNETMSHFLDGWVYTAKYDQVGYKSTPNIKAPAQYDEMLELAKKLSKPFKMVRVDFYIINNTLYLGELTFTPYSGYHHFKSPTADIELGEMLSI